MATTPLLENIGDIVVAETLRTLQTSNACVRMDLNFVENGGDSIHAIKLSMACRDRGIRLDVRTILQVAALKHLKSLATLDDQYSSKSLQCNDAQTIPETAEPIPDVSPSSPVLNSSITETQRSFLLPIGRQNSSNMIRYITEWPIIKLDELKRAWTKALASEPIFCSDFFESDGSWHLQENNEPIKTEWETVIVDNAADYASMIARYSSQRESRLNTFFTVVLPCRSWNSTTCTIIWHIHHALIDGISRDIVLHKVDTLLQGGFIERGPSFAKYARNLNAYQANRTADAEAFWKLEAELYGTEGAALALSHVQVAHSRSPTPSTAPEGRFEFSFPPDRLRFAASSLRVSISTLYFTAWALTLSAICNSDRVRFGVVLSGRNPHIPEAYSVVGPLIAMLPLNIHLDASAALTELARDIHQRISRLSEHSWTIPEHGYYRDYHSAVSVHVDDLSSSRHLARSEQWSRAITRFPSQLPLSVSVELGGRVCLQYQTGKVTGYTADSISTTFANTLAVLAASTSLGEAYHHRRSMISHSMSQRVQIYSNCYSKSTFVSSEQSNLVALFRHAAQHAPADIAVERSGSSMTYASLDYLSDCVARVLQNQVSRGEVVGVCADRSLNWIIAIYAVLKIGAVYCPLHRNLPHRVRDEQLNAAQAKAYLLPSSADHIYEDIPKCCSICLTVEDILAGESKDMGLHADKLAQPFCGPHISPEDPAYVCFTSGTSGKPKGAICKHGSLVAFQRDFDVRLQCRPGWKVAQTMSPSFDGSIHEIFSALSYGATLVLPHAEHDPLEHLKTVDAAILTPTAASAMQPDELGRLGLVYLVGEVVSQQLCDTWAAKMTVFNMYGPTEVTCGVTIGRLLPGVPVNIGKPVPSARVYVLDRLGGMTPPGIVGEVFLAGIQVSQGYLGMPTISQERFMNDHICPELGESMYRTGDRAFWNENGQLHLVGRNDRQIKYRGFRIDMDDMEARVHAAIPDARAVACLLMGEKLVVIITPESIDPQAARQLLSDALPIHMIPREIRTVPSLPLTRAGKLDYKAVGYAIQLSASEVMKNGTFVLENDEHHGAPMSSLEVQVADMWRKVLQLPPDLRISRDSNFIDLGGESTSALRLRSRIAVLLRRQVSITAILSAPTLNQMALNVANSQLDDDNMLNTCGSSTTSPDVDTFVPLTTMERGLCILNEGRMHSTALNVSVFCYIDSSVDMRRLAFSLEQVLTAHPVFRSRYYKLDDLSGAYRIISKAPLQVLRMSIEFDVEAKVNEPFDLATENPIRAFVSPKQMLIVAHHIVCDLTALRTVMIQVRSIYSGANLVIEGLGYLAPQLFAPGSRLKTRSAYQQRLGFWPHYLGSDHFKTLNCSMNTSETTGGSLVFKTKAGFWQQVQSFARYHKVTSHQFLLAVIAIAQFGSKENEGGRIDSIIGAPHGNREGPWYEEVVGLFLQPLPIRISWSNEDTTVEDVMASVKRSSQLALENAIDWESLCGHLAKVEGLPCKTISDQLMRYMLTVHRYSDWKDCLVPGLSLQHTFPSGYSKFNCLIEFFVGPNGEDTTVRLEYSNSWAETTNIRMLPMRIMTTAAMMINGASPCDIYSSLEGLKANQIEIMSRN